MIICLYIYNNACYSWKKFDIAVLIPGLVFFCGDQNTYIMSCRFNSFGKKGYNYSLDVQFVVLHITAWLKTPKEWGVSLSNANFATVGVPCFKMMLSLDLFQLNWTKRCTQIDYAHAWSRCAFDAILITADKAGIYTGKIKEDVYKGLILGLRPANERRCYFVTTSLIGWAQA